MNELSNNYTKGAQPKKECTPRIKLVGLSKTYENTGESKTVLSDINLSAHAGQIIVIRGDSGSGKTTLLRILGLLDNDFDGEYTFNDENVSNRPNWFLDELRFNNISFIFQEGRLFDHLTLQDNIALPGRLSQNKHLEDKIWDTHKAFDLTEEVLSLRSVQASGGQKQRAAIWRALSLQQPVILADEPTASLDKDRKNNIKELFIEAAEHGMTVIIMSHDDIFFDVGEQYELKDGKLEPIQFHSAIAFEAEEKTNLKEVKSRFSGIKNVYGWLPRAGILPLLGQILRETFGRKIFLFLVLVSLIAGVSQLSVFASLIIGAEDLVNYKIKNGSRLNRIYIKPKRENLGSKDRFPDRQEIIKNNVLDSVLGRREGNITLLVNNKSNFSYSAMGLHDNDPEFKLLHFLAGGKFSKNVQDLEIIVTTTVLRDLFPDDFTKKEVKHNTKTRSESLDRFINRNVEVEIPSFTNSLKVRQRYQAKLKLVGIISKGEGGRQVYLPNTTLKVFDQVKKDRTGTRDLPVTTTGDAWNISPEEVRAFSTFPWEDRLHIYTHSYRDVPPVFKYLAQIGYRPHSDFWGKKWVLDIRDIAFWTFIPLLVLIVLLVSLTVTSNIYLSAKIREKEFALWRILGMRKGDLALSQIFSVLIMVIIGCCLGLLLGYAVIEGVRSFLIEQQDDQNVSMIFAPLESFAIYILVGAMIMGILSAFFPARNVAKTDPAKVLQS